MKKQYLLLLSFAFGLASCTQSRYATTGAYESDDAYYTTNDTYISDFALVDDEAAMSLPADSTNNPSQASSDDYYDPNYITPQVYAPNSSANNWSADPWNNNCGNPYGSNFGNYQYGSHWNCSPMPMAGIGWNPYGGYYSNSTMGYGSYYNPYSAYNPYSSWYTPYYPNSYYSGWAYNPWNSPYNYYNTGGNDNSSGGSIVYGPRNPISTISATNTSYSEGLFYNGTKRDLHAYVNTLEESEKPELQSPVSTVNSQVSKPRVTQNDGTSYSTKPTSPRPTYTASKPRRETNLAKPGLTTPRETLPKRDLLNTAPPIRDPSRTTKPKTEAPLRDNTPTPRNSSPSIPRTESPTRETPRAAPRTESSPSRNSGGSSTPSRSSGGSTSGPRKK